MKGLEFDILYVIKTRAGFVIAEITRFLNYFSSYYLLFKIVVNLKILENFQEYGHSEFISL